MFRGELGDKTPPGAQFQEILHNLDVEFDRCTFEKQLLTGELGWHAPNDHIFEVTGEFVVDEDIPHVSYDGMPIESWDLLKKQHQSRYQEYLEETDGDETEAKKLVIKDIYGFEDYYRDVFEGKWLVIAPNVDGSKTNLVYPHKPSVMVKGDPYVWYDQKFFTSIKLEDKRYHFDPGLGSIGWVQWYTEVSPEFSQRVRLVYKKDPKLELYVPDEPPDMKFEIPIIEDIPAELVIPEKPRIIRSDQSDKKSKNVEF